MECKVQLKVIMQFPDSVNEAEAQKELDGMSDSDIVNAIVVCDEAKIIGEDDDA